MNTKFYYKIKQGTNYDKAVKEHFKLRELWRNVFPLVNELLNEQITRIAQHPEDLYIDTSDIKREENKKLFNKDGKLKSNTKRANQIREDYKQIIQKVGLSEFRDLGTINFIYGVMRLSGEHLQSYRTSDNDIYYESDFDLEKRSNGLVVPITEIEYQEKYLEELKNKRRMTSVRADNAFLTALINKLQEISDNTCDLNTQTELDELIGAAIKSLE